MKNIKFIFLFVIFLISACRSTNTVSPTIEPTIPISLTETKDQPTIFPVTPTKDIPEPTQTPVFIPPTDFKEYKDTVVGVSIYIPENWVIIQAVPGQLAYLQSYPEDKYIGGEALQSGDTKCDFYIRPPGSNIDELIQEWKSGPFTNVISEDEIILRGGQVGNRLEIESMGHSISVFTQINERVVVLSCFGDLAGFNAIAGTLGVSE